MNKRPTFFWSGFAWADKEACLLSLVNTSSDRRRCIVVESFDVRAWSPQSFDGSNSAGITTVAPYALGRVTSIGEGGIDVAATHLGGTASLPSGVKVRVQAPVSSTDLFSRQVSLPFFSPVVVTNQALTLAGSSSFSPLMGRWIGDAAVQPVVLSEGTGFAIIPTTSQTGSTWFIPPDNTEHLSVLLRDETNGRTYVVCCELASIGCAGVASFVVFNEIGSGIILSVLSVERSPTGGSNPATGSIRDYVRFLMTRGARGNAEAVTAVAADPSETLPSWVELTRGRVGFRSEPVLDASGVSLATAINNLTVGPPYNGQDISSAGAEDIAWATNLPGAASIMGIGTLRRAIPHAMARLPSGSNAFAPALAASTQVSGFAPARNGEQLIIPPGRGFAAVAMSNSGRNGYFVELAFSWRIDGSSYARAFA